ncbi:hypothetical protein PV04_08825 [Phialophora macrospora]|uniref:Protein ROT1 n=1 Tax=Phialophora macrospora TaxID=1851006 RepID=A0A0D2F793_9EURO|nr:hypothetical protein PV04_08825 [Phialophora macrospora]
MMHSISNVLTVSLGLLGLVRAQYDAALVGTWTTKSKKVITGPGFYDPVADKLIEPDLAGISYSFTADGFFEEAYYRSIPNPTTPQCPSSIMQWQHGTYVISADGSITLTPFGVDGRQLTSAPCSYDNAVYIRYEQPELFKSYQVLTDPFHNVPRLNLFQFDGSPMQPLYLVYNPPQMLPTQTLNPTSTSQATGKAKAKRDGEPQHVLMGGKEGVIQQPVSDFYNADRWWWAGVGLTALGTVMYMLPTST